MHSELEHHNRPASLATATHRLLVLFSVFILGACGLVYELVAGAAASYLMGDSVTQYSLVIGVFLAAMGLGSYLTQWIRRDLLSAFLKIQLAIGLLGGFSGLFIFAAFTYTDEVTTVVLAMTGTVGTLVGMEIPLVVRLLQRGVALRVNLAQVLTCDYLGALAASAAFPFLVLPLLGLTRAGLAFGALNVLVATFGTALFWHDLRGRWNLCLWNTVGWAALLGGLLYAGQATSWLEDRLYQDEIILAETTPYQRIVITRWGDDIRLHLNGHLQFSSADEYRYHEALVFPAMAAAADQVGADDRLRVLILGGGDGLALREVLRFPNVSRVDLVDIDPRIVELFRDRSLLADLNDNAFLDQRVSVHSEDAMVFLREPARERYDVIIMDLPDPGDVHTSKLYTRTFFGMALRHLTPRGALVTQATSPFYAREAFWCIARTLEAATTQLSAGRHAQQNLEIIPYHVHVPSFGEWGFLLAAPRSPSKSHWPSVDDTRFLSFDVFTQARVFAADLSEVATSVNELDNPVLVRYHEADWSKWND